MLSAAVAITPAKVVGPGLRSRVLLVDNSPDVHLHSVAPIQNAGAECVVVPSVRSAAEALGAFRPLMVMVDAGVLFSDGADAIGQLRNLPTCADTPLVLLATTSTPTELIETSWRVGVDDCLLRPLRLAHVLARKAVLGTAGAHSQRGVRPPRVVLLHTNDPALRARLGAMLEFNGFHLLYSRPQDDVAKSVSACSQRIDLVICAPTATSGEALPTLRKLHAVPGLSDVPTIVLTPEGSPLPAIKEELQVAEWFHAPETPLEAIVARASARFGRVASNLRADSRVPFFCPVEFRAANVPSEAWTSSYSFDLSPGGLFLKTLVPGRPGSPIELRIHLTTTREVIEGTGVVAWANHYATRSIYSYPIGMGVQFLGMSPKRLAQLRAICSAS